MEQTPTTPTLGSTLYHCCQSKRLKAVSVASATGLTYAVVLKMLRNEEAPKYALTLLANIDDTVNWLALAGTVPAPAPEIAPWYLDAAVMIPERVTDTMTQECGDMLLESTALHEWVSRHQVFTMEALDKALLAYRHKDGIAPRKFGKELKNKGYFARVERCTTETNTRGTQRVWRYNPQKLGVASMKRPKP